MRRLLSITITMIILSCSTDMEDQIRPDARSIHEKEILNEGYYYDGKFFKVSYIVKEDSISPLDQASSKNYIRFLSLRKNAPLSMYSKDFISFYSSEDLMHRDMALVQDTLPLDKLSDQSLLEDIRLSTSEDYGIEGYDTIQNNQEKVFTYSPKMKLFEFRGIFGKRTLIEISTEEGFGGRIDDAYHPDWDFGPNTSFRVYQHKNYTGASSDVLKSTALSKNSYDNCYIGGICDRGISWILDLDKVGMHDKASSALIYNYSTRVMQASLLKHSNFWCNRRTVFVYIPPREGSTYYGVGLPDLSDFDQSWRCEFEDHIDQAKATFFYTNYYTNDTEWINLQAVDVNSATFNETSVRKTSSTSWWNAGATATNSYTDGYFHQFTAKLNGSQTPAVMYGLSITRNSIVDWDKIDYNLYLRFDRKIDLYHRGQYVSTYSGTWSDGDLITISPVSSDGKVHFYKNSDYVGYITWDSRPSSLYSDICMYTPNATIENTWVYDWDEDWDRWDDYGAVVN